MIKPGTPPGSGQPSSSSFSTSITGSALKAPFVRWKRKMLLAKRGADEPLLRVGVVKPAHLERDQARLAEVQRLHQASLREIPEVEPPPVPARRDVLDLETRLVGVRLAELR